MKEINLVATSVFERNYEAVFNSDKRFIVNQGGSRSSKSWSVAQLVVIIALKEPNITISIIRKTLPALRESIMKDLFLIIEELGIYKEKNHNKSQNKYVFDNGSVIEFFSISNQQRLRGRKRDYAVLDEANEIWEEDFFQLNLRTTKKFILMYNPSERDSWIYNLDKDKTIMIKSTYKDNPFLEQVLIDEIEGLKDKDDALYTIFALGERAITRENIYSKWQFIDERPSRFTKFVYGIDFGFVHKTALVKVWYYEDEIFIEDLIYESSLTSGDILRKIEALGITYKDIIVAEVARPEINEELRRANLTVINADKNIKGGINDLQRKKVYTNSKNVWKEYENYTWKKVNGKMLEEPTKILDDILDAIRYATRYITKYNGGDQKTYMLT